MAFKLLCGITGSMVLVYSAQAAGIASLGQNFTGTSLAGSGFIPPDTTGAIGPSNFVELLNGNYSVYTRTGSLVTTGGSNVSLDQFWRNAGVTPTGFSFDPRIVYDAPSGRWFAASADNAGRANNFLIAVSKDSNPLDGWTGFKIKADSASTRWADFPTLGVNKDGVYLSANMFPINFGSVTTTQLVLPKSDLTAAVPTVANRTLFQNTNANNTGYSVQPVIDMNNGGLPEVLLSAYNTANLKTSTINGPITSPTLNTTGGFITVPLSNQPPNAVQKGSANQIDTGDSRFSSNVVLQNGILWAVHNEASADGSRSQLHWYEINASTHALLHDGVIGDSANSYYYGSIAVNPNGQIAIGFSRSGPNQFVSSYVLAGKLVAGVPTFDMVNDLFLTKAGTGSYSRFDGSGNNRWGDYSETTLDPNNPSNFWTVQEWAGPSNTWETQVTELTFNAPPPSGVPEPASLILIGLGALGLTGYAWRQKRQAV